MANSAAAAFVTRHFESMLKDCGRRKFPELQKALKAYLERCKSPEHPFCPISPKEEAENFRRKDHSLPVGASGSEQEDPSMDAAEVEPSPLGLTSVKNPIHSVSKSNTEPRVASKLSVGGHTLEGPEVDLVLLPLHLAFETKKLVLVESALDCLHKLLSYEHLEGDAGLEGGNNNAVAMKILYRVCAAAENDAPDSTDLQVLKVLLTAVASKKFRVHGECLLTSINTCFAIALTSKSVVNVATARATLAQMISIVLRRMDSETKEIEPMEDGKLACEAAREAQEDYEIMDTLEDDGAANQNPSLTCDSLEIAEGSPYQRGFLSREKFQHLAGGADTKEEETLAKTGQPNRIRLDLERMTLTQRDTVLVFNSLSKMAMQEENDDSINKMKMLSLELLQGLLESIDHSFSINFNFIDSIKTNLCHVLRRAFLSSIESIYQIATGIFTILLLHFRESLKAEIGVFFPMIVLRSLDNPDSPLDQRIAVLRMLVKVCRDSQMLADIFVNYDCDLGAINLFEHMVNCLSRIAQGTLIRDSTDTVLKQNALMKTLSLQCLVNVLQSLVDWTSTNRDTGQMNILKAVAFTEHSTIEMNTAGAGLEGLNAKGELQFDKFENTRADAFVQEAAVGEFHKMVDKESGHHEWASQSHFLLSTPCLHKSMMDDYLGQCNESSVAIMHSYVDTLDLKGMKFDIAIRGFLEHFHLPRDAEKVDCIMEKFAERYCHDNPGLFRSADVAYVLAYAVIMLNADAHNPMVWPKMSKADFIWINSGNDSEEVAPRNILEEIYNSVFKNEIRLKDVCHLPGSEALKKCDMVDQNQLVTLLNLGLQQRKLAVDTKKESEQLIKQIQALYKQGVRKTVFYKAEQMQLARPMLESVGWAVLAAFSVTMEESDNKYQIHLCMEGLRLGIHLMKCIFMNTMHSAFLTALVRFTFLHAPKEMKSKNLDAIWTLFAMCKNEPDSLQGTWNEVLECVSRLADLTSELSITIPLIKEADQVARNALVESLKVLAGKPSEQVFVSSEKLPSDAIVEFFTALCGVSAQELKHTPPRVFSLQKLVEISNYNMTRIRMVWVMIWKVLSQHFIFAASLHNEEIAAYSVDSLRQLGMKYLERVELPSFTFQNAILKPFVVLFRNCQSTTIRLLIVDCIFHIVRSKGVNIKSGWQSVFMVFDAAAYEEAESVVEVAFENMEQVVLEHFHQGIGDYFLDCIHCLITFAKNKSYPRISLKSIALLRICEDRFSEGFIPGGVYKPIGTIGRSTDDSVAERHWFAMLIGLSDLICDSRMEVRNCALEVLYDLLRERGHKFSPAFWENIFHGILFPIFNQVKNAGNNIQSYATDNLELAETCIHSLQLMCNLFSTFYKGVSSVLHSLVRTLLDCATIGDQMLASVSLGALVHLVEVRGDQFDGNDWSTILEGLRGACYASQPVELLNSNNIGNYGIVYSSLKMDSGLAPLHSLAGDHMLNGTPYEKSIIGEGLDGYDHENSLPNIQKNASNKDTEKLSQGQNHAAWDHISSSRNGLEGQGKFPGVGFFQNQMLGQKSIGSMTGSLSLKNLAINGKGKSSYSCALSSPEEDTDAGGEGLVAVGKVSIMESIRHKCAIQLLFMGVLDNLQRKHWIQLQPSHKILIMDTLHFMVDFAASYNSYQNLLIQMQQFSDERPHPNLFRQEIEGTQIYLAVLCKAITQFEPGDEQTTLCNKSNLPVDSGNSANKTLSEGEDGKLKEEANQRLFSFSGHILMQVKDLQTSIPDTAEIDGHPALSSQVPVVVEVLNALCKVDNAVFQKHLHRLYPYFTNLICCKQITIRKALSDLFKVQISVLLS